MSRRAADEQINLGKVLVNGAQAVLGQKIDPEADTVSYLGQNVGENIRRVCVMLNKPRGYVTTMDDERGRKCVADLVTGIKERVYPIGRLDRDSEGLLLMTNDGELTNMLTHPRYHKPKLYQVKISGRISDEQLGKLARPMKIDDYITRPAEVRTIIRQNEYSIIELKLFEGRNRQIRKMCDLLGLSVLSLKRTAIGEIKLGTLAPGEWKYLSEEQINLLKREEKNV